MYVTEMNPIHSNLVSMAEDYIENIERDEQLTINEKIKYEKNIRNLNDKELKSHLDLLDEIPIPPNINDI